MSWQTYVDHQICAQVPCKLAVIGGSADGQIWAKYEMEAPVTQQELKAIADGMKNNPNSFQEKGIHLGGEKYLCLQAENNLIRGRKGSSALCIVATNTCLLCAATKDGTPAGQLNIVVEKLGDYLRGINY